MGIRMGNNRAGEQGEPAAAGVPCFRPPTCCGTVSRPCHGPDRRSPLYNPEQRVTRSGDRATTGELFCFQNSAVSDLRAFSPTSTTLTAFGQSRWYYVTVYRYASGQANSPYYPPQEWINSVGVGAGDFGANFVKVV